MCVAVLSPTLASEVSPAADLPATIFPVHVAPWLVSTATGLGTSPTTVLASLGKCPGLPLPAPTSWQRDLHKSVPVWAQLQFNQLGIPHPPDNSGGGPGEDACFPGHCLCEGKPLLRVDGGKPSTRHFKCHTRGWGRSQHRLRRRRGEQGACCRLWCDRAHKNTSFLLLLHLPKTHTMRYWAQCYL